MIEMFSEQVIASRVAELAAEIDDPFNKEPLLAVVVLRGAVFFACDLVRRMQRVVELSFVSAASYVGTISSGHVVVEGVPDVRERDVLLVEDIVDTGATLHALRHHLHHAGARDVRVVALLNKRARRAMPVAVHYVGFDIDDAFVVGYGLDLNGAFRNLPSIYRLQEQV